MERRAAFQRLEGTTGVLPVGVPRCGLAGEPADNQGRAWELSRRARQLTRLSFWPTQFRGHIAPGRPESSFSLAKTRVGFAAVAERTATNRAIGRLSGPASGCGVLPWDGNAWRSATPTSKTHQRIWPDAIRLELGQEQKTRKEKVCSRAGADCSVA